MKRRRNLLVVLLALCTLCVGVGYAALSDGLTIEATAGINVEKANEAFNEDVHFENPSSADVTLSADADGANDKLTIAVASKDETKVLSGKGNIITYTVDVKNAGDVDANVTINAFAYGAATMTETVGETETTTTPITGSKYFDIKAEWTGQDASSTAVQMVPAGKARQLTVTIEVLQTPVNTINAAFSTTLNAVSVN